VLAVGHPNAPDRLFVVEQGGHVKVLEPGQTQAPSDAEAFLFVDVQNAGATMIGPEMGLLGFALHPNFPDDPRVYVNYNPAGRSTTVISEFQVGSASGRAENERVILELHQPASNHNGGMLTFGPDGMLYIGMGDGGGADDTFGTGNDPEVLLAKILRIDPEMTGEATRSPLSCKAQSCQDYGPFDYGIPADNPFVGDPAVADEVFALGFRNPWRFAFDGEDLWVADVGQNAYEEVDLVSPGSNHGWSDMEGFHCFGGASCDELSTSNAVNADGLTMPVAEYGHNSGSAFRCSVTGGAVYRSCEVPGWQGGYLFADYCSTEVFGLRWNMGNVSPFNGQGAGPLHTLGENVLGFGSNAWGDVYFTSVEVGGFGQITDGRVYRVAPAG
jgi:glucose/arabinose dehydrogenase